MLWSYLTPKLTQKYESKCQNGFVFFGFWPPEESVFEWMTNLKFSFSQSGPGSVNIL